MSRLITTYDGPIRNRGPPTKKWLNMFDEATAYKDSHGGSLEVAANDEENADLYKWIKYQRLQYKYYLENPLDGKHAMTAEKVQKLKDLGFEWIFSDKLKMLQEGYQVVRTGKRGRPRKIRPSEDEDSDDEEGGKHPIRQKWLDMFERLKTYKAQSGSCDVPKDATDESLVELRTWCANQKSRYSAMSRNRPQGMTEQKIELLTGIGFVFPPRFEEMYDKLVVYKRMHGHINISEEEDPIMFDWIRKQNEVLGRHMHCKPTRMKDEQAVRLMSIGFLGGRGKGPLGKSAVANFEFDTKWNEMLLQLRDFKVRLY